MEVFQGKTLTCEQKVLQRSGHGTHYTTITLYEENSIFLLDSLLRIGKVVYPYSQGLLSKENTSRERRMMGSDYWLSSAPAASCLAIVLKWRSCWIVKLFGMAMWSSSEGSHILGGFTTTILHLFCFTTTILAVPRACKVIYYCLEMDTILLYIVCSRGRLSV